MLPKLLSFLICYRKYSANIESANSMYAVPLLFTIECIVLEACLDHIGYFCTKPERQCKIVNQIRTPDAFCAIELGRSRSR